MNYETKEIKTKRLVLKRGTKNDFLKVYEYNFKKLNGVEGICDLEKNNQDTITKVYKEDKEKYYNKCKKAHIFDWIMFFNDKPIGNILAFNENKTLNSINILCNLHPAYWGKGFMPEALEEVISYLFSQDYDSIICSFIDGNKKAKRILEKLNFKPYMIDENSYVCENGNKKDEYILIMTKEDWLSRTLRLEKLKMLDR